MLIINILWMRWHFIGRNRLKTSVSHFITSGWSSQCNCFYFLLISQRHVKIGRLTCVQSYCQKQWNHRLLFLIIPHKTHGTINHKWLQISWILQLLWSLSIFKCLINLSRQQPNDIAYESGCDGKMRQQLKALKYLETWAEPGWQRE